jgi:hypothetical protein
MDGVADGEGDTGVSLGAMVDEAVGVSSTLGVASAGILVGGVGVAVADAMTSTGTTVDAGPTSLSCNWAVKAQPNKVKVNKRASKYAIRFDINPSISLDHTRIAEG